jgi:hypothetical protein
MSVSRISTFASAAIAAICPVRASALAKTGAFSKKPLWAAILALFVSFVLYLPIFCPPLALFWLQPSVFCPIYGSYLSALSVLWLFYVHAVHILSTFVPDLSPLWLMLSPRRETSGKCRVLSVQRRKSPDSRK